MNMGEYINAAERYLRLALKAQSQCRATLETLATIKNPPVIYAKQANIANGPQQVNNSNQSVPVGEGTSIVPNKLLEQQHEQWLDASKTGKAVNADPEMATLEYVDRDEVGRRESDSLAECI